MARNSSSHNHKEQQTMATRSPGAVIGALSGGAGGPTPPAPTPTPAPSSTPTPAPTTSPATATSPKRRATTVATKKTTCDVINWKHIGWGIGAGVAIMLLVGAACGVGVSMGVGQRQLANWPGMPVQQAPASTPPASQGPPFSPPPFFQRRPDPVVDDARKGIDEYMQRRAQEAVEPQ